MIPDSSTTIGMAAIPSADVPQTEAVTGPTIAELLEAGTMPKPAHPIMQALEKLEAGMLPPIPPPATHYSGIAPRAPAPRTPNIPVDEMGQLRHPTKHQHADLMKRWLDDQSLRFYWWDQSLREWREAEPGVVADGGQVLTALRVAHTRPTEPLKRYCALGSFSYPEPESVAPREGADYWTPYISHGIADEETYTWSGDAFDQRMLSAGMVHLTPEGAQAQARAILNASKAALAKLNGGAQ